MSELEKVEADLQAAERELYDLGASITPQVERLAVVEAALRSGHTAALEAEAHQLRRVVGKRPIGLNGTQTRITQLTTTRDAIQHRAKELVFQAESRRREVDRMNAEIAVIRSKLEIAKSRRDAVVADLAKIDAARCSLIGVTFDAEARQREVAALKLR